MVKFEDKYVHFRWSDELAGKQVWAADSIPELEDRMTKAYCRKRVRLSGVESYPFKTEGGDNWKFVYYDPNYDCKVAFNEGQPIQCRQKGCSRWADTDDPCWDDETEYRIKPGLAWSDLKLGDAVRQFNRAITSMVTAFDMADETNHVHLAGWGWVSDTELAKKWFKM